MNGNGPSWTRSEPPSMLRLSGVGFKRASTAILHGIDLDLSPGTLTTLLGPSGSGKTTVLQIIAGHLTPVCGTVWIQGRDATRLPPEQRGLGMVHQHLALFPHLSALRNVSFGLEVRGVPKAKAIDKAQATLDLVGLENEASWRLPHTLSGGQRQRVALARALAFDPTLLLLDEPFNALDRHLRDLMRQELKRIQRQSGVTTLLVTHDQEEALGLSDQIVALCQGQVAQAGTPADLYQRPRDPWLAGFLGEANLIPGGGPLGGQPGETLLVRPEWIRLGSVGPENSRALRGPVESATFQGSHCLVRFQAMGLTWKILVPGMQAPKPGETLEAHLSAGGAWNIHQGCPA